MYIQNIFLVPKIIPPIKMQSTDTGFGWIGVINIILAVLIFFLLIADLGLQFGFFSGTNKNPDKTKV